MPCGLPGRLCSVELGWLCGQEPPRFPSLMDETLRLGYEDPQLALEPDLRARMRGAGGLPLTQASLCFVK